MIANGPWCIRCKRHRSDSKYGLCPVCKPTTTIEQLRNLVDALKTREENQ